MSHNSSESTSSRFSFSGLVLIGLGIVFLLNNFGILPWAIWESVWRYWPVLLILIGVETIIGNKSLSGGIGFIFALIFILPVFLILNPFTGNPLATKSESFTQELGSLSNTTFNFDFKALNLQVSSLGKDSKNAFESTVRYTGFLPKPTVQKEEKLGEGIYTFNQPTQNNLPFLSSLGNSLNFKLSPLVPTEIKSKSSSGVINLNLDNLHAQKIEVENTAGQINITFAKDYSTKVYLKTSAALINLTIPKEVSASIKTNSSLKSIKLDEKRFIKKGDTYSSSDFQTNTLKVEIEIASQAASVSVK